MARQLSLFDQSRKKRASGRGPGIANRNKVYHDHRATHTKAQAIVLQALRELGEATLHELAAKLGRSINTFSGRLTELSDAGYIEHTGETRGRCKVWRVRSVPVTDRT